MPADKRLAVEQPHDAKKHPRDMRADERRDAMSSLARKRWEKARMAQASAGEDLARQPARDASDASDADDAGPDADRVGLVRVPIRIGEVMRDLEHRAIRGDTSAARELRAWMAEYPPDDAAADASDLDPVTRAGLARILARALAEYEEVGAGPQVGDGDQWFDAVLADAEAQSTGLGGHQP